MGHATLIPNLEYPLLLPMHHRLLLESSPPSQDRPAPASCLESLRDIHASEGLSERASALILSGWSSGTNKAYQFGWKKWVRWCSTREIDPISSDVQHFVDFLVELHEQGLRHRSINTIRSVVSMTHTQVEGSPIGQHPLVTRLLKGAYYERPPMPRYTST